MDSCPVEERGDNNDCGGKQSQQLSLDTLKAQLESLETELQNKDRKLEELQKEYGALEKDLDEKNEEAADLRRLWKKTAKELDKVRANNQGFYQITDEYLIEQINHLRISIRDFSIQYFDGKCSPKRGLTIYRPSYRRLLESTTSKRYLDDYIRSPVNCHQVVQSFLWKVVVEEILDSFEWAGRGSSEHFRQMWKELGPREYNHDGHSI
jgi:archaellum component FlaC